MREGERERERERERESARARESERERERDLLGIFHNGKSRAMPAYGLRITILTCLLDRIASIVAKTCPGLC